MESPSPVEFQHPSSRRPQRIIAAILLAILTTMVILIAPYAWRLHVAEGELAASQAWAHQTTIRLRAVPGGEKLKILVPLRCYYLRAPDWFFVVSGPVLDDAADARLHEAFNAAGPPKNVRIEWKPVNCQGDAEAFKRFEADPVD